MALIVTPAAVITAIFVVLGMLQKGPLTYLLYKDSVSTRGYYWRAGIEMLKSEPFTGVGVDRYGAYFKQFREVAYPLKYGFEINSSNAHNTIIQIFSTAGLFVGVSYLFILGYIFFSGLKLVKNTKADQQKIALALLATWIGFQAQSIISIDMIGISVWGWLLGGSILGLSRSVEDDSTKDLNNNSTLKNKISATRINLFQPIVSSLVLVPALILSTYLYRSESNTYIDRSFTNPDIQQNKQVVYEYANRVINNPMSDPYYRFQVSINLYTMGFKDEAYVEILKLVKYDDKNLDYLYTLSLMEKDRLNIPNAIFAKEQIAKYDPWNAENYFQLYMLYKEVGDTLKAEKIKNKVLDFAPDSLQAKSIRESLA
jgi:tetratricopeptide (TPR) repeat protein